MAKEAASYKFERPEKFPRASVLWAFGSDPLSKQISERIGLLTNAHDILFANDACNRKPEALSKIKFVGGRRAVFEGTDFTFAGANFNSIEIGGFGFQPMEAEFNGAMAKVSLENPIAMPSSDNFAAAFPTITKTEVMTDDGVKIMGDNFSFSGAYTLDQTLTKVAANLFLLDKISQIEPPPFVVPIPISIGFYPDIVGPDGKCAHYIVWKVPYEGKRQGEVPIIDKNFRSNEFITELVNQGPKISNAIRYLHDLGLTHNQLTPGNYFVPEVGPMLLADFSTIQPLSYKREALARSNDLIKNISSIFKIMDSYQSKEALRLLYHNVLVEYGVGYLDTEVTQNNLGSLILNAINHAISTGRIIQRDKSHSRWRFDQIKKIRKNLVGG